jgi:lipopolysaccharide transport system ATP-binding protein
MENESMVMSKEHRTNDIEKDSDVLVRVEHVSKKFCKKLKQSLWYGVRDLMAESNPFSRRMEHAEEAQFSPPTDEELRKDEFWAVSDVSFELKRGECLGLIGHNGAGKSTLLKMLNGIIKPDKGRIEMRGRVGALIELGAGFNPILTGRENIYNKGSILGFTKKELDDKFDAIVDFAEVSDFLDMPVQNYSSGMKVRLGFAVSAMMEPDVLIIDEVLAVGDLGFRMKCYTQIGRMLKNTAVVFVSHSMPQLARICDRAMFMSHGKCELYTREVSEAIDAYYAAFGSSEKTETGTGRVLIQQFEFLGQSEGDMHAIRREDGLHFSFFLELQDVSSQKVSLKVEIWNQEVRPAAEVVLNAKDNLLNVSSERLKVALRIPNLWLSTGRYFVTLIAQNPDTNEVYTRVSNIGEFQMKQSIACAADALFEGVFC